MQKIQPREESASRRKSCPAEWMQPGCPETKTQSLLLQNSRSRGLVNKFQRLIHENLARPFTEARAADVLVPLEAIKIFFSQNVAEGIVGQTKQQIIFAPHFAFQVVTDVRQRLAGNRQNLRVTQIQEIELRSHSFPIAPGNKLFYQRPHQRSIHRKSKWPGKAREFRIRLHRRSLNNSQGLIAEQIADALTLLPISGFAALISIIRRDHPALCAIHKNCRAAAVFRNSIAKRPDKVRTANARAAAQYLRMNRVVDQRSNRFARLV